MSEFGRYKNETPHLRLSPSPSPCPRVSQSRPHASGRGKARHGHGLEDRRPVPPGGAAGPREVPGVGGDRALAPGRDLPQGSSGVFLGCPGAETKGPSRTMRTCARFCSVFWAASIARARTFMPWRRARQTRGNLVAPPLRDGCVFRGGNGHTLAVAPHPLCGGQPRT